MTEVASYIVCLIIYNELLQIPRCRTVQNNIGILLIQLAASFWCHQVAIPHFIRWVCEHFHGRSYFGAQPLLRPQTSVGTIPRFSCDNQPFWFSQTTKSFRHQWTYSCRVMFTAVQVAVYLFVLIKVAASSNWRFSISYNVQFTLIYTPFLAKIQWEFELMLTQLRCVSKFGVYFLGLNMGIVLLLTVDLFTVTTIVTSKSLRANQYRPTVHVKLYI